MIRNLNKIKPTIWFILLGVFTILIIVAGAIYEHTAYTFQTNIEQQTKIDNIKTGNKIGERAPDFSLKTIDNRDIKLSDYRGKYVILNFWATWCGPCRYEIPTLQTTHETWKKADVVIIAINTQDGFENAYSYAKAYGLTFTIPVDIPGKVAELYGVRGLPTTFFINSDGIITYIKIGPFINKDEIEQYMASFK